MKNEMPCLSGRVAAVAAVAAMLMSAAQVAAAGEPGIYLGADIGTSSVGTKTSDLNAAGAAVLTRGGLTPVALDTRTDKNAISPGVTWGYRFSPKLAAEITVLNLGKATWKADGTASTGPTTSAGSAGLRIKSTGPAVSVLGSWPLNESFSIDGRAGGFFFWTKVQDSYDYGLLHRGSASNNEHDAGLFAGVGGTWNLTRHTAVRAGYTFFKNAIDGEDASRIAAGFTYSLAE
jgi:opacity protein-like surface antigen